MNHALNLFNVDILRGESQSGKVGVITIRRSDGIEDLDQDRTLLGIEFRIII